MAKFTVEYLDNGNIKNTLLFDGEEYSFTMRETEEGFISDKQAFEYQVDDRFNGHYDDEVLDALAEICYYTDSDDIAEHLETLSNYEN